MYDRNCLGDFVMLLDQNISRGSDIGEKVPMANVQQTLHAVQNPWSVCNSKLFFSMFSFYQLLSCFINQSVSV